MPQDTPSRKGPGRPADPDIEPRILAATLDVYREVGWSGLTLDLVARRAGVGKAALYRRWDSKEKLIVSALASQRFTDELPDTGSLRSDLIATTGVLRQSFFGPAGLVRLRAAVEAKIYPQLFGQAVAELRHMHSKAVAEILRRAVQRGEVADDSTTPLILETVISTLIQRFLVTPVDEQADFEADYADNATQLVDFVLAGAHYRPSSTVTEGT
ncbi:TetR/AcrR family transcriptional regulator [Streptomyces sp. TM32]|uniref:TetR/AcrR family transcriptional regulator n=1 Tax=Streptomyces sp. TM32 TaxID=1652669 RepID=UPI001010980D|nr:TetR/AcrR family transcriptional regulator [Streptomyces sp. TM32]RXS84114.1 TetR/AcrR family transcriptional regulator [Streptomyces sp. TM32]